MEKLNLTIGVNCTVENYTTKQKGYGRQGLFCDLRLEDSSIIECVYIKDVFPNILEHFDNLILKEDAFPALDEDLILIDGKYTDYNGNGSYAKEDLCDDIIDLLNKALKNFNLTI